MAVPGQKGVLIAEDSARDLSRMLRWFRGEKIADVGAGGTTPPTREFRGPFLGKTQQIIAINTAGPVNFWTGYPQGEEVDTMITIQAYLRADFSNSSIPSGKFVLFDIVNGMYEIVQANPCT